MGSESACQCTVLVSFQTGPTATSVCVCVCGVEGVCVCVWRVCGVCVCVCGGCEVCVCVWVVCVCVWRVCGVEDSTIKDRATINGNECQFPDTVE